MHIRSTDHTKCHLLMSFYYIKKIAVRIFLDEAHPMLNINVHLPSSRQVYKLKEDKAQKTYHTTNRCQASMHGKYSLKTSRLLYHQCILIQIKFIQTFHNI